MKENGENRKAKSKKKKEKKKEKRKKKEKKNRKNKRVPPGWLLLAPKSEEKKGTPRWASSWVEDLLEKLERALPPKFHEKPREGKNLKSHPSGIPPTLSGPHPSGHVSGFAPLLPLPHPNWPRPRKLKYGVGQIWCWPNLVWPNLVWPNLVIRLGKLGFGQSW